MYVCTLMQYILFTTLGRGVGGIIVASDVRRARRPSVRVLFPEQISETHTFCHIAHTHPLGLRGVVVRFGVYEL